MSTAGPDPFWVYCDRLHGYFGLHQDDTFFVAAMFALAAAIPATAYLVFRLAGIYPPR
jgi:hypothetical protein